MTKESDLLGEFNSQGVRGSRLFSHLIFFTIFIFVGIAIIWANLAILDEVTVGDGKVIPSRDVQVIQSLDGGIVSDILVKEGEIVEANQILMKLDDTRSSSSYEESRKKMADYQMKILRLTAEFDDKPFIVPEELAKENPDLVQSNNRLYATRVSEYKQFESGLALIQRELDMTAPLVKKGAASQVEVLRIQRSKSELKSKMLAYRSSALNELNKTRAELNALKKSQLAHKDRLTQTVIRAPLKGIIKQININTIGGVVKSGMDILEIVPFDDTLLIEADVRPSDIGFIHVKQIARVKITAYDFSIYGGLEGVVEHISADTIENEEGESFYQIKVRTNKNYLGSAKKPLYIIPGMKATVDILTGQKSVMDYLLKPILKARNRALRER